MSRVEARKVQKVGYSTLIVSLPKWWVEELGLKAGNSVFFKSNPDGTLALSGEFVESKKYKCVIDADLCKESGLLTRLIVGNYILGNDTIEISSKSELKSEKLKEIRRIINRLTGVRLVEQSRRHVVLQSFIDPTKFSLYGLMRRLHIIVSLMLDNVIQGIVSGRRDLVKETLESEEEVDRFYWLITRQILLAAQNKEISHKIGVDSPLHLIGNRVIAKYLESVGDRLEVIAKDIMNVASRKYLPDRMLKHFSVYSNSIKELLDKTMISLLKKDIELSNNVAQKTESLEKIERILSKEILGIKDVKTATAFKSILLNLKLITKYCSGIAEIIINRALEEKTSKFCKLVELSD